MAKEEKKIITLEDLIAKKLEKIKNAHVQKCITLNRLVEKLKL